MIYTVEVFSRFSNVINYDDYFPNASRSFVGDLIKIKQRRSSENNKQDRARHRSSDEKLRSLIDISSVYAL